MYILNVDRLSHGLLNGGIKIKCCQAVHVTCGFHTVLFPRHRYPHLMSSRAIIAKDAIASCKSCTLCMITMLYKICTKQGDKGRRLTRYTPQIVMGQWEKASDTVSSDA